MPSVSMKATRPSPLRPAARRSAEPVLPEVLGPVMPIRRRVGSKVALPKGISGGSGAGGFGQKHLHVPPPIQVTRGEGAGVGGPRQRAVFVGRVLEGTGAEGGEFHHQNAAGLP